MSSTMLSIDFVKTEQVIDLYIPRILGSLNRTSMINLFKQMNIGDVLYLDMHRKVNEKKNAYYFAFLSVRLFDTPIANNILNDLKNKNVSRIVYDEEANRFWEIKYHIRKELRISPTNVVDGCKEFDRICDEPYIVIIENKENKEYGINIDTNIQSYHIYGLSEQDKYDISSEYEEVEKDIHRCVLFNNILLGM